MNVTPHNHLNLHPFAFLTFEIQAPFHTELNHLEKPKCSWQLWGVALGGFVVQFPIFDGGHYSVLD